VSIWVVGANAACAVALLALVISEGARGPWSLIYLVGIALLAVGIILEVRGSRWSSLWNVGLFLSLAAASMVGGSLVDLLLHRSTGYSEGALATFVVFGLPALGLASINFLVFRRRRLINAA